jgi:response regulator RpfG family c-di-GMP phosphodiesterase
MATATEDVTAQLVAPVNHRRRMAKVLCIDDDPRVTRAVNHWLQPYELDVLSACDGMHGFWLAVKHQPDVIITDVGMTHGQGDYLVECLRANPDTRHIPLIVLTGRRHAELEPLMRHLKVDAYLPKPAQLGDFVAAVGQYVELREAVDGVHEADNAAH